MSSRQRRLSFSFRVCFSSCAGWEGNNLCEASSCANKRYRPHRKGEFPEVSTSIFNIIFSSFRSNSFSGFKIEKIIKFVSGGRGMCVGSGRVFRQGRDSIAIEDYEVIGIPAAHSCPCRRHTHSNTGESLSYRIALFSYIFRQFFPEIPLASSRSLIKTTINGKTLLFPKCKINFLRVGG